ncbi:MAG: dTDP-4-dehydrorhamnose reductase [Planctomycetota bacterium]|jgi:dTDP-4-dehydrorhamnose reductase
MTAKHAVLILGGTGQLGSALVHRLGKCGAAHVAPPRSELDLMKASFETVLAAHSPTAVINAAAYNDVNGAELDANRHEAARLNAEVPAELARICAGRNIPLIHVSTDYVFDGQKRDPYLESDPIAPLQQYGRTKADGERAVVASHPGALVVRTSTVFGPDRRGGSNYVAAVLANARASAVLELVRPPVSSPTYAPDLAWALIELLEAGATGIVHVANRGGCSRYDLAAEAVRRAGLADQVELRERPAPTGVAARPAYSVLDTSRFTELTGQKTRPWQDAVRDYVKLL